MRTSLLAALRRAKRRVWRMKIYVSVDMEGIAGIVVREQLRRGEALYEEGRRLLTAEVNALVAAIFAFRAPDELMATAELGSPGSPGSPGQPGQPRAAGVGAGGVCSATEVIVKDAHGTGFNFHVEHLHEGAEYVLGPSRMEKRFPGLDETFDGAMLIGYHAMAGTAEAVRDHSYVPTEWQSLSLNGRAVGEIAVDALFFGLHGVPVLLVSGDDKACAEARDVLPGVVTYETKRAFGKHVAITRAPARVYRELPDIVAQALASLGDRRPKREPGGETMAAREDEGGADCGAGSAARPGAESGGAVPAVAPLRWEGPYELIVKLAATELADARYFDGVNAVRQDGTTALYRGADLLDVLARGL